MVQKFYSIRSRADVTRALVIAGVFSLFMAFGAYFSGALTHLYYGPKLPPELLGPKGPIWDKIMPHFITTSGLPEALVLVIVLMVFSASMSSLSSLVLVSSSAIAIDLYGAFGGTTGAREAGRSVRAAPRSCAACSSACPSPSRSRSPRSS